MGVRYRLRYRAMDFEVKAAFVVGRSPGADLTLDDALVSRQHARFATDESSLTVEDLGSRNGVLVNGERLKQKRSLGHLDRVTIGSQDLVVIDGSAAGVPAGAKKTLTSFAASDTTQAMPLAEEQEETRTARAFDLLRKIAEKSMAMGRFDEAERILSGPLRELLARAERTRAAPEELDEAVGFALRLASGRKDGKWIDWVFSAYAAYRVVPSMNTVDRLYELVDSLNHREPAAIRALLEELGDKTAHTASERFALKRLHGLAKVITA